MYGLTQWELWNPLIKQYLANAVLFGKKDLLTYEMTVKLKSNFA